MSRSNARSLRTWAAALVTVAGAATMLASADTIYVNGTCGNDAWTGTSSVCAAPNGPKLTIQAGIDASSNGNTVLVADGTYIGVGNKNLDFGGRLITLRSDNGPEVCIIDCENDGRGFYFHNAETADAVLDGFTIRNGNVSGNGGGILCESSSPTVTHCTFSENSANFGGGMCNDNSSPMVGNCTFTGNSSGFGGIGGGMSNLFSTPTVTNCTFTGNFAFAGGGMDNQTSSPRVTNCTFNGNEVDIQGGGMHNNGTSDPTVTHCIFNGNVSSQLGAGMSNNTSNPTVTNCTFSGNSALVGGGMQNWRSDPAVTGCIFSGNSASFFTGGGMNNELSSPTVINCTFSGNSADSGGGIFTDDGSTTVTNGILWNDSPDEIVDVNGAVTTVSFSNVQGGWPGQGNIDADPLFDTACNSDYGLAPGSPCIDAGNNTAVPPDVTTDLCDNPRFFDDPATPDCRWAPGTCGTAPIVDMGAYEFQGPCDPCDMNCDGDINAFDIEPFLDLLFGGGNPCNTCTGDMDGNGVIDAFDIEPFLNCLFP